MADCSGAGGSIFNFNLEDFPYRANGRGWVVELHLKPPLPLLGLSSQKIGLWLCFRSVALFYACVKRSV